MRIRLMFATRLPKSPDPSPYIPIHMLADAAEVDCAKHIELKYMSVGDLKRKYLYYFCSSILITTRIC